MGGPLVPILQMWRRGLLSWPETCPRSHRRCSRIGRLQTQGHLRLSHTALGSQPRSLLKPLPFIRPQTSCLLPPGGVTDWAPVCWVPLNSPTQHHCGHGGSRAHHLQHHLKKKKEKKERNPILSLPVTGVTAQTNVSRALPVWRLPGMNYW